MSSHMQWLKCNWTQGNALSPPPVYVSKCSSISDCYNARKRRMTKDSGLNLHVPFHYLTVCTLTTDNRYIIIYYKRTIINL